MRIEQHISQLLYRYQCVTVPGFGAFLTENRSAQLVQDTNTFYPPKKVLSFNFHLKNNDGLLA
ncbi:MAG TPA: SPOR domain-containing protein, partial [Flavobacterium sp.]|nr:SPOR domain-containing protein [Flavobacterium sp.]